eukprot:TRINITY_DN21869_c0_g2_i1.p1 TRINITY_DN21869_c0_g2~~TRINITY_DN21869_c0_g2_i1.p1  ORF type:complete len:365 (+),score=122.13 TRINITY_DN21869_c0_g2_i1:71-1096(+)
MAPTGAGPVPIDFDQFPVRQLREQYDGPLLRRFHGTFMRQMFPIEEELDPVAAWEEALDPEQAPPADEQPVQLHILVVFDPPADGAAEVDPATAPFAGGVVHEYYAASNTGLMSYFAVSERWRRCGMARWLLAHVSAGLAEQARRRSPAPSACGGCDALEWLRAVSRVAEKAPRALPQAGPEVFASLFSAEEAASAADHPYGGTGVPLLLAETNALGVEDGVMDPAVRHRVMERVGFRALPFGYVQPPLATGMAPCYDLLLLAHQPADGPPLNGVPVAQLRLFLAAFALSVSCSVSDFTGTEWWQAMDKSLRAVATASGEVAVDATAAPWRHRTERPPAPA